MWYVYFLKLKNGNIYIGITNNIKRRFLEHKTGKAKSTKNFLPLKLSTFIAIPTKRKAHELEEYFKTGSGKAVLKKRILTDEVRQRRT